MERYLWLVFLLILVYLIVSNGHQFKTLVNSLSHAQLGAITALQGNNPGAYVNG